MPRLGMSSWPRASVIVPAHNEGQVIGRVLGTLLRDASPGEFEVVVVCNGCTDGTASEASRFSSSDVRVLEIPEASKPRALNTGDEAASAFPRLYLDADVELDTVGARVLVEGLATTECVVATPSFLLDGCTGLASVYWRSWLSRNPSPRSGTGCYGLSQSARESFGPFPDVLGDDQFIGVRFQPSSMRQAETSVRPARTLLSDSSPARADRAGKSSDS